jgi:hypothetical protein
METIARGLAAQMPVSPVVGSAGDPSRGSLRPSRASSPATSSAKQASSDASSAFVAEFTF